MGPNSLTNPLFALTVSIHLGRKQYSMRVLLKNRIILGFVFTMDSWAIIPKQCSIPERMKLIATVNLYLWCLWKIKNVWWGDTFGLFSNICCMACSINMQLKDMHPFLVCLTSFSSYSGRSKCLVIRLYCWWFAFTYGWEQNIRKAKSYHRKKYQKPLQITSFGNLSK